MLREVVNRVKLGHHHTRRRSRGLFVCLFGVKPENLYFAPSAQDFHRFIALSLEFRRTLKIIAKMLREVVNRVKLGDHYARRGSRGEVQSCVVRSEIEIEIEIEIALSLYRWNFVAL